jgi:hypothetical protein
MGTFQRGSLHSALRRWPVSRREPGTVETPTRSYRPHPEWNDRLMSANLFRRPDRDLREVTGKANGLFGVVLGTVTEEEL